MPENNSAIASMLHQIGALLDEQGVAFKPAAYRRAAQVIEELPQDLSEYPREVAELKKLPSVGEAIAKKIIEYLETGKMEALEKLRKQQGGISAELMDIEGLGPKRVRVIQDELGISTIDELKAAAKTGKLRDLPRFDVKLEEQILAHAGRVDERTHRYPRADITYDVEKLLLSIQRVDGVARAAVAGSYRRKKETVGDIDILVVTKQPKAVSDAIAGLSLVRDIAAHGEKKLSFDLHNGLRVDVRFVKANEWGSALLYFTGSKEHNIMMRKVAIKNGWKLSEYGLFDAKGKVIAQKEEADIYEALELEFVEPEKRL